MGGDDRKGTHCLGLKVEYRRDRKKVEEEKEALLIMLVS
jgi:hypothetical protein